MPTSFDALAVLVIAILPGASFMWALERIVGGWGIGFSDRVLRFIGVSAILHLLAAGGTYLLWFNYFREGAWNAADKLPWWLWLVVAAYVLIPIVLGTLFGLAVRHKNLPEWLTGSNPAPTAWDQVFFDAPDAWIRMKLKSGPFIGGAFAKGSYAGGYPEPADLWLKEAAEVDPDTGEFARDAHGQAKLKGYGLLVRWDELEYLEFAPRP